MFGVYAHRLATFALLIAVVIFAAMSFSTQSQVNHLEKVNRDQATTIVKLKNDGVDQLTWNTAMYRWSKVVTNTVLKQTAPTRTLAGRG